MAEIPLSVDPSKTVGPIRDLADALDEIQNKTEDTGETFKTSFSASTKAVDTTTDAIQDQTKAQKKNADEVDKTKKGMVDFQKKSKDAFDDRPVDEFRKSANQAGDSVDDLGDDLDDLDKKSGETFGAMTEGLNEIGGEFEGLSGSLISGEGGGISGGLTSILGKLGPIGAGVAAVVGTAVALGTEIVEIDQKFDSLRSTVESLFQVTGEQADRIVVNVEAIANTFDEEVNEVLLATNTLAKEFGLSGEEASLLLQRGFNSAANAQGDLIDSVKEFSSQVRASGGDAEDLFAILEKSNQEGIFSDKGIDVVKEFGLRIREQAQGTRDALTGAFGEDFTNELLAGVDEGSITSIEALKLVSEELGGLAENSSKAQLVIADVFGGAGEDAGFRFLTQLKDINAEQRFGNQQLTEQQRRTQESFEANQRLAAAQNELSKAIGDSSSFGRIWTDIQTGFFKILVQVIRQVEKLAIGFETLSEDPVEGLRLIGEVVLDFITAPLRGAISVVNETIEAFTGFEDVIPTFEFGAEVTQEWTREQKKLIDASALAQEAIKKFGTETAVLTGKINKQFDALAKGTLTQEKQLEVVSALTEQYGEQIGELDLLTASEEELLEVKNRIIAAEIERAIVEKRAFADRRIQNEIEIREEQLKNENISDNLRARLEDEIEFLETTAKEKIDLVEEETRIRLGLQEFRADETLEAEEELQDDLTNAQSDGQNERIKNEQEFNKLIQEILKRGRQAELNDQFISAEDRINLQRDFQREQLALLKTQAEDLNEQLTGSRQLDQEVIDAFNRADEKIITDAQDKITEIYRKSAEEIRKIRIQERNEILGIQQERFDQEIALLAAQEAEELAILEGKERRLGESTLDFENRIELERLDIQSFYLAQRIQLLEQEQALKLEAIDNELKAIEGKEGAEVEAKRRSLEEKKKLIEQETQTQKEQLDLQLKQTDDAIIELESRVPSLGEVFGKINEKIAESLGLTPEQLSAIVGAVQQVASEIFNTIQESVANQIQANDEVLAKLDEREDKVKESLEREIEFAAKGYAANVDAKRAELAQIEEAQLDAQKVREELLREQQFLDEISQASSLVSASANLYKSLSVLPFGIGIGIATALTGAMIAAFIATKAKARNVASLEKGAHGDDHGIITGKRHSQGGENFADHIEVEQGEMWSVYNRKGSQKYRDLIAEFTSAVNNDNMSSFMHKKSVPDLLITKGNQVKNEEVVLQGVVMSNNMSDMEALPAIKEMIKDHFDKPERNFFTDAEGHVWMHEVWNNGRTKKTKLSING